MSDQPTQSGSTTELDAKVDALIGQLSAAQDDPSEMGVVVSADTVIVSAPIPDPPASSHTTKMAGAGPETQPAPAADTLLDEISTEIERDAPGQLPTPPTPPAPPAPPEPAARAPASAQPTPEEIAAAARDVEADLSAFEPPAPEETASAASPAPVPSVAAGAAPATQASSAPAQPGSVPRPGPEIKKLDAALAAGAERALAEAQRDIQAQEAKKQPEPEAELAAPPEPVAEPAMPAPPAPPKSAAPVKRAEPKPLPAPALVESAPAKHASPGGLLAPLRPIAALHEKLGESTRQTIAYCAAITIFFAACVWGRVLVFPPKAQLEPKTEAAEFYDDTTPAHGVAAPAKASAESAGEHGSSEEGHAAPKKDAHSKPKPEKKSSHAESSHGSEASAAKKSSKSKKTASAEEH